MLNYKNLKHGRPINTFYVFAAVSQNNYNLSIGLSRSKPHQFESRELLNHSTAPHFLN